MSGWIYNLGMQCIERWMASRKAFKNLKEEEGKRREETSIKKQKHMPVYCVWNMNNIWYY